MKQINNGYCDYYYLTEDGMIYNSKTEEYKVADKDNRFALKKEDGSRKKIALKVLYNIVYSKPYCKDNIKPIEGEIWKEIDNTNGLYYVSNMGRIKSYKGYNAIILKPTKTKSGYYRLDIVQSEERVSKLVHRLVAQYFLELPSNIEMELHHKDCDKGNNKSENLEWLTRAEHRKKHVERRKEKCQTITAIQTKEV